MTAPQPPRLLSFPPRLSVTGAFCTTVQGSELHTNELIAQAMTTGLGERDQVPTYGVRDPAFAGFELGALQRHLMDFGPHGLDVEGIAVVPDADGTERVAVSWSEKGNQTGGGW